MHYDLLKLVERLQKLHGGNIEEKISSTSQICTALGDLIDHLGDAKMQVINWKYHIQTLSNKILLTSFSIISICKGYELRSLKDPKLKVEIIDYQSTFILCRALIENYVTLYSIYNKNLSEEEKLFKYKLWEVSGLITRQNYEISIDNDFINEKKGKEAELISKIISEIEGMKEFATLDKQHLRKLRSVGLPRINSWHSLIRQSNLSTEFFQTSYSFFSTYSHSEFLSILQLSQSNVHSKNETNLLQVKYALTVVQIINSLTINFFISNYNIAEIIYNMFPNDLQLSVETWKKFGT